MNRFATLRRERASGATFGEHYAAELTRISVRAPNARLRPLAGVPKVRPSWLRVGNAACLLASHSLARSLLGAALLQLAQHYRHADRPRHLVEPSPLDADAVLPTFAGEPRKELALSSPPAPPRRAATASLIRDALRAHRLDRRAGRDDREGRAERGRPRERGGCRPAAGRREGGTSAGRLP